LARSRSISLRAFAAAARAISGETVAASISISTQIGSGKRAAVVIAWRSGAAGRTAGAKGAKGAAGSVDIGASLVAHLPPQAETAIRPIDGVN